MTNIFLLIILLVSLPKIASNVLKKIALFKLFVNNIYNNNFVFVQNVKKKYLKKCPLKTGFKKLPVVFLLPISAYF